MRKAKEEKDHQSMTITLVGFMNFRIETNSNGLVIGDSNASACEEASHNPWPQYQNERPALTPRYLKRSDFPSVLEFNSQAWHAKKRRTPWTLVIYGLSGVGKSQICLAAIAENKNR